MLAPTAGTVRFEGRDVRPLTRRARPPDLLRLQLVFQNPFSSLNPRRRVGDQIGEPLTTLGLAPRSQRAARVAELLRQVGLSADAARGYPHEFSGGQRQRIAIARALAAEPSVIVLDEPLASLDASAQAQLANLLVELARELELGLLLISHDLAIVRHVADLVARLPDGLDTEVAHRGATLSGGERQRIAIARALLRRPTLLLLDEAASQLDAVNEMALRDTVTRAAERCAVLAIAHRLSTVTGMDRIVYLDGGRIVEEGSHAALVARQRRTSSSRRVVTGPPCRSRAACA